MLAKHISPKFKQCVKEKKWFSQVNLYLYRCHTCLWYFLYLNRFVCCLWQLIVTFLRIYVHLFTLFFREWNNWLLSSCYETSNILQFFFYSIFIQGKCLCMKRLVVVNINFFIKTDWLTNSKDLLNWENSDIWSFVRSLGNLNSLSHTSLCH